MSDFDEDFEFEAEGFDDFEEMEFDCDTGMSDSSSHITTSSSLNLSLEPKKQKLCCDYRIISPEQVNQDAEKQILEFSMICNVSVQVSKVILRNFKWNFEAAMVAVTSNHEETLSNLGITPQFENSNLIGSLKTKSPCMECSICLEEYSSDEMFCLCCNHPFCAECWKGYLDAAASDTIPTGLMNIHCPHTGCMVPICDEFLEKFASEMFLEKFRKGALDLFVMAQKRVRFCPGTDCQAIMCVDNALRTEPVKCDMCSSVYCFNCSDGRWGDHRPAFCDQVKGWFAKAESESESITWLSANTKKCPKCGVSIEKNGGCMHMTCSKQIGGCGHEWCWLCRGPWSEHGSQTGGYYKCNKYEKSEAKKEDANIQKIKSKLDHYMFYYHRYESHHRARLVAEEQMKNFAEKEAQILTHFPRFQTADMHFLLETIQSLIECRRTLEFSYIYAYYIPRNNPQLKLFEFRQEDLEKYTNHLHGLYEKDMCAVKDFLIYKQDITNYTRTTMKFLSNFNKAAAEGFSE